PSCPTSPPRASTASGCCTRTAAPATAATSTWTATAACTRGCRWSASPTTCAGTTRIRSGSNWSTAAAIRTGWTRATRRWTRRTHRRRSRHSSNCCSTSARGCRRCARSPATRTSTPTTSRPATTRRGGCGASAIPAHDSRGTRCSPRCRWNGFRYDSRMPSPVSELIDLLSLERLEDNLFRGQSRDIGTKYVFGGQVLGQALSAAEKTLTVERQAHSLHAYFLRAGDIDAPIVYHVDSTRDGGSFSVRRVTAIQHGQVIFFCAASFQGEETAPEHQLSAPEVPRPEDIEPAQPIPPEVLETLPIKVQRWLDRMGPFEFRHVYPRDELKPPKRPPYQQV